MSTQTFGARIRAAVGNPRRPGPVTAPRDDAVTAALSAWLVGGLILDAWAHSNVPELESFFTPWHGVFYTGFLATSCWVLYLVWRNLRAGVRESAVVPNGYRAAFVAIPVFAISGLADWSWHSVFGIEDSIDILFSPSHLGLVAAMLIIVTAPVRSALARGDLPPTLRNLWPALLACGMAAALVLLFLQYGNALDFRAEAIVYSFSLDQGPHVHRLAAAMVISNLILLTPLLYAARQWRLPFGAALLVMLPSIVLSGAQMAGENLSILIAFVCAALGVDVLAQWLRPTAVRRGAYQLFALLAALFTWSLYIGVASSSVGRLPEVVELWTGAPVVAALLAWLVSALLLPTRVVGQVAGQPVAADSHPAQR
ncbi:hypothetical protein HLB23_04195 [Nocardia uniformis]|uniref:Uncharacterized protein n=1 Tax=Nocardia uniformis TaxID=53432 RepID=A0A849BXS7_9NOCA|nr:hypothetical protein [Nocardia uniformis]NNH69080.1 hypothetical protein [Nocardia uniformis]